MMYSESLSFPRGINPGSHLYDRQYFGRGRSFINTWSSPFDLKNLNRPTQTGTLSKKYDPLVREYYGPFTSSDYFNYSYVPVLLEECTFFAILRPRTSVNCYPISCMVGVSPGFEFLVGGSSVQGNITINVGGTVFVSVPALSMTDKNDWNICVGRFDADVGIWIDIMGRDGIVKSEFGTITPPGIVNAVQAIALNDQDSNRAYVGDIGPHGFFNRKLNDYETIEFIKNIWNRIFVSENDIFNGYYSYVASGISAVIQAIQNTDRGFYPINASALGGALQ